MGEVGSCCPIVIDCFSWQAAPVPGELGPADMEAAASVDPCPNLERELTQILDEDAQPTGYSGLYTTTSTEWADGLKDAFGEAFGEDEEAPFPETQRQPSFSQPLEEANKAPDAKASSPSLDHVTAEPTPQQSQAEGPQAVEHPSSQKCPDRAPLEATVDYAPAANPTYAVGPNDTLDKDLAEELPSSQKCPDQAPVEATVDYAMEANPSLRKAHAAEHPEATEQPSPQQTQHAEQPGTHKPHELVHGSPQKSQNLVASQHPAALASAKIQITSDDEDDDSVPCPPPAPSQRAIQERIRRLTKPRADGTYPLPDMFIEQFRDLDKGRSALLHMFERCNFEIDRFSKSCLLVLT